MRLPQHWIAIPSALLLCVPVVLAQNGAADYSQICAKCHGPPRTVPPASSREILRTMTPERVLRAMESGSMVVPASFFSIAQRRAVAEFVTEKALGPASTTAPSPQAMCQSSPAPFDDSRAVPQWSGWGANLANSRFQDASTAGFTAAQVPRLKPKWAFGFLGDANSSAQPTIAGGRVFVGSQGGRVYSLSADTGCVHWWFDAPASVRSAIVIGRIEDGSGARLAAFFGDVGGNVYAVAADTGRLLWRVHVDSHPAARITGSPAFYGGRLYVPVSSIEELFAIDPRYQCCRFRGSVVALDGATGKQVWKTYTINQEAHTTTKNEKNGTQLWGPSGAPIWSNPTIDVKKNVLYVTTGNNYSFPTTTTSDAFLALSLESGGILWSKQVTGSDVWNSACRTDDTTNCPDSTGPDFDFGAPPILATLSSDRRVLVAGQKSGLVYAIDPDKDGAVIWQVRVGKGGAGGGIEWGSAADESNVYVALSDMVRIQIANAVETHVDPNVGGGMFALRLQSGERVWHTPPGECGGRQRCSPAQSAAVSAIPGVAFSGSVDGHLRAYSARDGAILWDFDTSRPYQTVNLVEARGGSLDGAGAAIGNRMLFVNSGYAIWGGMPGNVLLAFSVDGK